MYSTKSIKLLQVFRYFICFFLNRDLKPPGVFLLLSQFDYFICAMSHKIKKCQAQKKNWLQIKKKPVVKDKKIIAAKAATLCAEAF